MIPFFASIGPVEPIPIADNVFDIQIVASENRIN
jgi:hypothetical protein